MINEGKTFFFKKEKILHVNFSGKPSGISAVAQSSSWYMMYFLSKRHRPTGCKINKHNSSPGQFCNLFFSMPYEIFDLWHYNKQQRKGTKVSSSSWLMESFIRYVRSTSLSLKVNKTFDIQYKNITDAFSVCFMIDWSSAQIRL